ncbi:hypothetical protein HYS91_01370 [Candidatus Daviesbacteria bacterium]|nr:hypothetical protein [Candidatus Daviesbacteria bacterium]
MNSNPFIKIPTLLGLTLLAIALGIGIILFRYHQYVTFQTKAAFEPKSIKIVNISDSSATITWNTDNLTTGKVLFGETPMLGLSQKDERDLKTTYPRLTHFVTLKNLSSEKNYYFQVLNNEFSYPDQVLQFKTNPKNENPSQAKSHLAVSGSLLSQRKQLIDDALVFLKIPRHGDLATFITPLGNFIITVDNLNLESKTESLLIASSGNITSQVKITLSQNSKPLPPIVLGEDADFSNLPQLDNPNSSNLDINLDGSINSLDLSLVLNNIGKQIKNPRVDINFDGKVDQKDVELIKQKLR